MKQCKICGKSLVHQRSDAIFCSDNCRVKNNQHQNLLKNLINPLLSAIQAHEARLAELVRKQQQLEDKGWELNIDLAAVQSDIIDREELLKLTDREFRQQISKARNVEDNEHSNDYGEWEALRIMFSIGGFQCI